MAKIIVLDTETTGLDKPFCYDLGYVIVDTETEETIEFKSFVIEQSWHNLPLFESAYYKEKRPKYVEMMRKHDSVMTKWGYAMRELRNDIRKYGVTDIYAYNSPFDDKVIAFNCDWYKTINPIEDIPIHDIWGYASQFVTNNADYKLFCETNERFTDSGNYKGSAEVVYQFLKSDPSFIEEHMGLFDSEIESAILIECIHRGAEWGKDYSVNKVLNRPIPRPFEIKVDGTVVLSGTYLKKYVRDGVFSFKTK